MAEYLVQDTDMAVVADAIRAKGGTSEPLTFPDGMAQAVEAIKAGGGEDADSGAIIFSSDTKEFSVKVSKKRRTFKIYRNTEVPGEYLNGHYIWAEADDNLGVLVMSTALFQNPPQGIAPLGVSKQFYSEKTSVQFTDDAIFFNFRQSGKGFKGGIEYKWEAR